MLNQNFKAVGMEARKNGGQMGTETDKILGCNCFGLQDISSFEKSKYPHSENILLDVKTACWTLGIARLPL